MVAPAAAAGGFAGSWSATDFPDGSSMHLKLEGGGGHFSVHMVDDAASVCGGAPANVVGSGVAEGNELWTRVTLTCKPGGNFIRHRLDIALTYDATDDTLTDDAGIVWSRAG
jgi:hypothetical protein